METKRPGPTKGSLAVVPWPDHPRRPGRPYTNTLGEANSIPSRTRRKLRLLRPGGLSLALLSHRLGPLPNPAAPGPATPPPAPLSPALLRPPPAAPPRPLTLPRVADTPRGSKPAALGLRLTSGPEPQGCHEGTDQVRADQASDGARKCVQSTAARHRARPRHRRPAVRLPREGATPEAELRPLLDAPEVGAPRGTGPRTRATPPLGPAPPRPRRQPTWGRGSGRGERGERGAPRPGSPGPARQRSIGSAAWWLNL